MIDNYLYLGVAPYLPRGNQEPPTLYSIMNSIVNFDKPKQVMIKDLAKNARAKIFDFNYPLSTKVEKEAFEVMILNHFIENRIGFQTITLFKIKLENKLNVIMPKYNKMFDSLELDFYEGDSTVEKGTDDRTTENTNKTSNTLNSKSESNSTTDSRNSDTPQNKIEDVKSGEYVSNYSFDESNGKDSSSSLGESSGEATTLDKNIYEKEVKHINGNKVEIYLATQNIAHIYDMIFEELSTLFYGIY